MRQTTENMNEAKNPARERELDKTTALYNAATDYAAYVNSEKHDFDEAMKLSDALEAAAVSYAELAGDRQPAMSKTPKPSTLASATGYTALEFLQTMCELRRNMDAALDEINGERYARAALYLECAASKLRTIQRAVDAE